MVPPVWPSPRPDIFGALQPHAATMGLTMSVVLSPTPPVECLSILCPTMAERSTRSPDAAMILVRAVVSAMVMPRRQIAMRSAAT